MLVAQLNRYLAHALEQSPRARELCHALEGRSLRMEIEALPGAFIMSVARGTLLITHVSSDAQSDGVSGDVTVKGTPFGLLALAGRDASLAVGQGGANITGDEALAPRFQELARLLRPNVEAEIARVIGRMPAHLATRAFSVFAIWAGAACESLSRNAAEYLAHESRDLVPRAEAESFFTGVEALRSTVTSAEMRVAQISERLAAFGSRSMT
jgi:ubiquinone biosynthesis accessory factor UbiJ